MATFVSSFKSRLIYVFAINDEYHQGCLKIGETTLNDDIVDYPSSNSETLNAAARKRIDQYTKTAGIAYNLLHTELTIYSKGGQFCSFNDKEIHSVLERSGIKKKTFDAVKGANEWFCCGLETVKNAIRAVKEGRKSLDSKEVSEALTPIIFRPEQQEAIERTKKQFKRGRQMLWNAKMRFGKTLCALRVVKDLNMKRTLIITHRPVVDEGWFEDFGKTFYDRSDFHYGSRDKGEPFSSLEKQAKKGHNYAYFVSMQDMRGSETVGGKFDKNSDVYSTKWDFIIVDEAHEGTQTDLGKNVLNELCKENTKILRLSGTPFNLLDDYNDDEIFTWDYVMEQKAKADWDITHWGDPNPYASLPTINIYTYDLGRLMSDYGDEEKAFNFREFFRTREDDSFVHDKDIDRFLDLLCRKDKNSLYPYADDDFRKIFRHTLWVLPGVKAAHALSAKLKNHSIFSGFTVVNVAGNCDEENMDALQLVNKAIGQDSDKTFTITLSCGRLTTGVSIKPWTAVFMMAGSFSTSAAGYMQTIFRVQTPYIHNGRMKTECYVFDFAPDRTLRVLAEVAKVSAKAGKQRSEDRKILGDFLNFCPIISIEGSKMKPYDVDNMMSQLKRAQIEKVVQCGFEDGALYNDELLKLTAVELKEFQNLKGIIGKTKAMPHLSDIDVNKQGLTNEQYAEKEKLEKKKKSERTDEEQQRLDQLKALSNQRREAIAILRGISIRMPLMLYGAEIKDENTELTIDNFTNLVDDQSWEEFMPKGVSKKKFNTFKKYYDPDIFREAGKRIREMARMADRFTIEQRIERITAIFQTFRNPDKETVLTPWRVVNMHLGDCLGGYCFYDEQWEHSLSIPRYIHHEEVTDKVWHPDSIILEINSKSGLYPLYAAYNIYRAKVEAARKKYGDIERAFSLRLWDLTLEQNILVVCKTPMARSITRRTLAGFRDTTVHAQYYKKLIENITKNPSLVVKKLKNGKDFWAVGDNKNMKIDAIIGNPPYQVMDGGGSGYSAVPVYNKFVNLSKTLTSNAVSLIIPARWYTSGKGLDNFRQEMLSERHINRLFDFHESRDLFPSADIAGGICYYLWLNQYEGLCNVTTICNGLHTNSLRNLGEYNIFIRQSEALNIVNKIAAKKEKTLDHIVFSRKPFGIPNNFVGSHMKDSFYIALYGSQGISYVSPNEVIQNNSLVDKWKVISSKASAQGGRADKNGMRKVLPKVEVLPPNTICTESYLLLFCFEDKIKAINASYYVKTKFFRFLLSLKVITQNISKECFSFIPNQDFSIRWTDKDLYDKYALTSEEILFIENTIKPMI